MIAIIDQGIEKSHPKLENCIIYGVTITDNNGSITVGPYDFTDDTGHGTAVASIIHRIVPKQQLFSVKLVSSKKVITEPLLCAAIRFCSTLENLSVVNISMGIAKPRASLELQEACLELHRKKILVVAASHNFGSLPCFPSDLPSVISVGCGLVSNKLEYGYVDHKVLAKGCTQRIAWRNGGFKISSGTSFATAHFSAIIRAQLLNANTSYDHVEELIKKNYNPAVNEFIYIQRDYTLIADASDILDKDTLMKTGQGIFKPVKDLADSAIAVFPASDKEIKTIVELQDETTVNLKLIIDYPRNFANILRRAEISDSSVIAREPSRHEYNLFDTLVVGYFMDTPLESNIIFGQRLIEACIRQNKNIVVFDNDVFHVVKKSIEKNPMYTGQVTFTALDKKTVLSLNSFQHLPPISVPVLSVIGTGSKQGKFTTQIRLKRILEKAGHKVSLVSTEPQGVLFRSAFTFPYGYNSNVAIPLSEWENKLDTIMRGVQYFDNPSIILTGIQGGILPRDFMVRKSRSQSIFASMHFLSGVRPDAVLCAINPNDSSEHIKQTIQTVNNYCKSSCILCMMTPFVRNVQEDSTGLVKKNRHLDAEEMQLIMIRLSEELGLPVIDIMDTDNDSMILQTIEQFFSVETQV